jgi:tol-pal system protein YbgF
MKRLLSSLLLGWACALFVVAPVRGADREHQQMMADIRMLQEQTVRLSLMLGTLDETLQTVLAKLDTQAADTRRAFADQKLMMDSVTGGVRVVREKVDETNVRVSSLAQEVEALRLAIPPMTAPLTRLAVDPETGLPTVSAPVPAPTAVAPVNPGVSPQRMYDTAWADFTTGQWALSIQGFEAYISTFPRSEMADQAQFYIGENHYADGKFREAADAYEQVMLGYPDGDVVAEALYKRGMALQGLGEPGLARQAFERVVQNYPDDNMANLAQQALDRLDDQAQQ